MATAIGLSTLLSVGLPLLGLVAAVLLYPRIATIGILGDVESDQLAAYVIGVTAIYLGTLLAFGLAWFGTGIRAPLLAIGFGLLGAALGARFPATATTRRLLEGATSGLLAYAASNIIIVTTTATATLTDGVILTLLGVLAAIPAVLVLPLGHADATNSRLGTLIRATIVAASFLLAFLTVATETGTTTSDYPPVLGGYLLIVAVLGVVPYSIGEGLAKVATR